MIREIADAIWKATLYTLYLSAIVSLMVGFLYLIPFMLSLFE